MQHNPLLGRVYKAVTPVRIGGVTGSIGSFGPTRRNPDGSVKEHKGIDLLTVIGWPVFAVHTGFIAVAGWENETDHAQGYGQRVKIESSLGKLRTVYAHLSMITCTPGARVLQGDVIGLAGRSGNVGADTAIPTHLHFEVHRGEGDGHWAPIDPAAWLMGA